jgi:hypothetical protein
MPLYRIVVREILYDVEAKDYDEALRIGIENVLSGGFEITVYPTPKPGEARI